MWYQNKKDCDKGIWTWVKCKYEDIDEVYEAIEMIKEDFK